MKKCNYRNCELEISDNKIYCCRSHKENEKKYRNRERNPKPKGRPKGVWKCLSQLTDDDIKKLSNINENLKKIFTTEGL